MSFFSVFSENGLAMTLSQTLENISNIVAPTTSGDYDDQELSVDLNGEYSYVPSVSKNNTSSSEELDHMEGVLDPHESISYDRKITSFFQEMGRNSFIRPAVGQLTDLDHPDLEPDSPSSNSMVTVDLDDNYSSTGLLLSNEKNHSSNHHVATANKAQESTTYNNEGSYEVISSSELEKKIQEKYRNQLEAELIANRLQYRDLEESSDKRIQALVSACDALRASSRQQSSESKQEADGMVKVIESLQKRLSAYETLQLDHDKHICDLNAHHQDLSDRLQLSTRENEQLKSDLLVRNHGSTAHIKDLEVLIVKLQEEKTSLVDKLGKKAAVVKEIAALKAALSLSEETVGSLTAERGELMERIDGLERKVSSLTLSLNQKQDAHIDEASFDVVKEDLMRSLGAVESELLEAQSHCHAYSHEIAELKTTLVNQQKEALAMQGSLQQDVDTLRSSNGQLMERLSGLEHDLSRVVGEYAVLRGEHGDMVATLDRERQRSQEDLKELSSQLAVKCAVIEQLEGELKEVRSVVSESETTHLSLTSELKTLEEEKASLVEKLEEVRSVQEEIMLHKLSREVELLDREGVLQASLSQSEGDVLALTAERQDMLLKIGDLERIISDLGERNHTLEQQLDLYVVESDGLKAEIIRSRDQMKLSVEALASSETSLKAMEEVAWHAKAEASELLFALEQEKSTAGTVTTRLVGEKQQLLDRQEELHALLQMRSNEISAAAMELESVKMSLLKANQQIKLQSQEFEKERQNVQKVISQLRSVRSAKIGDTESALAERDELRRVSAAQSEELGRLRQELHQSSINGEVLSRMREEQMRLSNQLKASEECLLSARHSMALLEKGVYERDSELEVTRSDMLLLRQELDQRTIEVVNLKDALQQVESERSYQNSQVVRDYDRKVSSLSERYEGQLKEVELDWKQKLQGEMDRYAELLKDNELKELLLRKAEMDYMRERKKMQQTIEGALAQLSNSQQDVIDRMLVANLIVNYFQRHRSVDVLKIIAKVLSFTDEQLVVVGLKVPPIDLLSSIVTTVIGKPVAKEVPGENLAEQWINYLIDESEDTKFKR